jgi:ferredoxin-NADP reductase
VGDSRTVAFVLSAKAPDRVFHYERYRHALTTRFTSTEPRIDLPVLRSTLAPVLDVSGAQARVCGPPPFMSAVVDHLLALGVHPDRIRSEAFV